MVALDLKTGELVPEYLEKMQSSLAALDDVSRLPNENSSMGIIVCKSENKTIVEYVLRESIDIATYKIVSTLPQELKNQIPEPEQFASL